MTVTDTANGSLTATQSGISVSPAAPTGLAATAVSSSQINLTWDPRPGPPATRSSAASVPPPVSAEIGDGDHDELLRHGPDGGDDVLLPGDRHRRGHLSAASNTASATTTGSRRRTAPNRSGAPRTTPSENSDYDGHGQTFELGVQFESNIAGEVTGVLFYKQTGTTGTNVGHLWSSSGTLLASATFTSETSGWQKVSFSSPVAILANTIYTVSFSTDDAEAGGTTGYFAGSYTNGPLEAPLSRSAGGNGVYGLSSGAFPEYSEYELNFWVQPAFSPSSGSTSGKASARAASTSGSAAIAIGSPGRPVTTTATATPSGPMGVAPPSRGGSNATATKPSVSLAASTSRPVVNQARTSVLWGTKGTSFRS